MNYRRIVRPLFAVTLIATAASALISCESTEEAVLPSNIIIEAGDGQYSKKGTALPEPLAVRVRYHDLSDAAGVPVRFSVLEGGGSVSRSTSTTDSRGIASTAYTLGPVAGTNRIRAQVTGETDISVVLTATAGDYYCPEEDPAFSQKIDPGPFLEKDLLLFTRNSRLITTEDGRPIAGLVRLPVDVEFRPVAYAQYEEDVGGWIPVRDCAFAHNGDFFLSWQDLFDEVVKVRPNSPGRQAEHFASLETALGGEITTTYSGVLVGCDVYGPFVVGCRDTVQRFEEALYSGDLGDQANGDAVAVDINPQSAWFEDIYFIDLSDNTLRRLPVDTLVAQGPTEVVAQLDVVEAHGARGMECNDNGDLFVLVDDDRDNVKAILRVTPAGVKTVEYDFFTRGSGTAEEAGTQSDLAIRRGGNPILYTIDTRNDMLLRYDVGQGILTELFPDTTVGVNPEAISLEGEDGERVGLVVIPSN
jgi:hypothetical protein